VVWLSAFGARPTPTCVPRPVPRSQLPDDPQPSTINYQLSTTSQPSTLNCPGPPESPPHTRGHLTSVSTPGPSFWPATCCEMPLDMPNATATVSSAHALSPTPASASPTGATTPGGRVTSPACPGSLSPAISANSLLIGYADLTDFSDSRSLASHFRKAPSEVLKLFSDLVQAAHKYRTLTGRHLSIFGELGEVFAEIAFGIKRHGPNTPGSDGRRGNDFIEIKTISPEKTNDTIHVKRAGNFNQLVVVKITDDFQFGARMVSRSILKKGEGKNASLSWDSIIANETLDVQKFHRLFPFAKAQQLSRNLAA